MWPFDKFKEPEEVNLRLVTTDEMVAELNRRGYVLTLKQKMRGKDED